MTATYRKGLDGRQRDEDGEIRHMCKDTLRPVSVRMHYSIPY